MKSPNSLKGTWKIVWMEQWDQDYVDMVVPGHITFEAEGRGHFQFGCAQGSFNWSGRDSYFDSRWEGCDEMDEARGEIYAEIENGELRGTVEFDNGDESGFRAVKKSASLSMRKPLHSLNVRCQESRVFLIPCRVAGPPA